MPIDVFDAQLVRLRTRSIRSVSEPPKMIEPVAAIQAAVDAEHPRARATHGLSERPRTIDPVVYIQASVDDVPLKPGTGFLLGGHPRLVLTARHVVMSPSGERATAIGIKVRGDDGIEYDIDDENKQCACYPIVGGDYPDADIAVIRVAGGHESSFVVGSLTGETVAVHGYGAGPVLATAHRDGPWLELNRTASGGTSGGPVCVAGGNDARRVVVGVFVGDSSDAGSEGKAYAIDAPAAQACINALK